MLPTPDTMPSRWVVLNTVAMNSPIVQPIDATAYAIPYTNIALTVCFGPSPPVSSLGVMNGSL